MSTRELINWININLKERNWIPADLARISGLSPATISRIGSEDRGVSIRTCKLIANAFNVPSEFVMRIAGIMSDKPVNSPILEEANYFLQQISDQDQKMAIVILKAISEERSKYGTDRKGALE